MNKDDQVQELNQIIITYKNYIDKFCEIAERNVSAIDEWGDENLDALSLFKKECIIRIAKKMFNTKDYKEIAPKLDYLFNRWFGTNEQNTSLIIINSKAPTWAQSLFNDYLPQVFTEYHTKRKTNLQSDSLDINKMDGIEFENFIGNLLIQNGYNVSGTPKTGDQGADLIASKNGKVFIIQVKRYSGAVGNKAIQEVVAAKYYYDGDIASVVTNSSFTASAIKLAKKNQVILINKSSFRNIDSLLNV